MKVSLKNSIREWVSTAVAIVILGITSLKLYTSFDTLTVLHTVILMTFFVFGISLIFVKDSVLKDFINIFINKKK